MSGARPCWEALSWALKYFSCEGRKDINKVRGRGGGGGRNAWMAGLGGERCYKKLQGSEHGRKNGERGERPAPKKKISSSCEENRNFGRSVFPHSHCKCFVFPHFAQKKNEKNKKRECLHSDSSWGKEREVKEEEGPFFNTSPLFPYSLTPGPLLMAARRGEGEGSRSNGRGKEKRGRRRFSHFCAPLPPPPPPDPPVKCTHTLSQWLGSG